MTESKTRPDDTVTMSAVLPWGLAAVITAAGIGLGFVVAPLVRWMLSTVEAAPGPLRILAQLPTLWAVLVTAVLGLAAGIYVALEARKESPTVTVADDHLQIAAGGPARWIDRAEVGGVLRDGPDLVLLDPRDGELTRMKASDLPGSRLRDAFDRHGYPWRDEPGYGDRFVAWVDGRPDLAADAHSLLRTRAQAVAKKETAEAATLLGRLRESGVVVRDRKGRQEIRKEVGA